MPHHSQSATMPRLAPSLLRQSHRISPLLRSLLPATRDLQSAQNELRWIREHVFSSSVEPGDAPEHHHSPHQSQQRTIARLCRQRGQGVPLQYILGSQPFGHLDIACQQGVLVPRPETEAWALHLGKLIRRWRNSAGDNSLRDLGLVDFCTGTGCIALSLYQSLQGADSKLHVRGVDISPQAVSLSRKNLEANLRTSVISPPREGHSVSFTLGSVFDDAFVKDLSSKRGSYDILVSNPPYISRDTWTHGRGQMGFSVKKYEPRLALVPEDDVPSYPGVEHEDVFYWRLLDISSLLQTRLVVFEVGDEAQALRVARMALQREELRDWKVELWRDWPNIAPLDDEAQTLSVEVHERTTSRVGVRGSGNVRCVVMTKIPSMIE